MKISADGNVVVVYILNSLKFKLPKRRSALGKPCIAGSIIFLDFKQVGCGNIA
jgi:hypothetical protein